MHPLSWFCFFHANSTTNDFYIVFCALFSHIHSCVRYASVRWNLVLYFFAKTPVRLAMSYFLSDPNESNFPLAHFLPNWLSFFIRNIIHSLQDFFILNIYHISWLADFFPEPTSLHCFVPTTFFLWFFVYFFHHISINKYKKTKNKRNHHSPLSLLWPLLQYIHIFTIDVVLIKNRTYSELIF
jgi:hypothetical protein